MRKRYKDLIPGGLAKGKSPKDFSPKSLSQGIKVEKEHTNDPDVAREISMDHLTEDPKYYDKLKTLKLSSSSPKVKVRGKSLTLSNYSGMLGTSTRYSFLWVLNTRTKILCRWRWSDGSEKVWEKLSNSSSIRHVLRLRKEGTLNEIGDREFELISDFMREKEEKFSKDLRESNRQRENNSEKNFRKITEDYFKDIIMAFFHDAWIGKYDRGNVVPFDFKARESPRRSKKEQLAFSILSKVLEKYWKEDYIFKYAEKRRVLPTDLDFSKLGNQDPYFIMHDVLYEMYDWWEENADL